MGKYDLMTSLMKVDAQLLNTMRCTDPQSYVHVLFNMLFFHTRSFPEFPPGAVDADGKKIKKEDIKWRRFQNDGRPMVEIVLRPYISPQASVEVQDRELFETSPLGLPEITSEGESITGWMFYFNCVDPGLDIDAQMGYYFDDFAKKIQKNGEGYRQKLMADLESDRFSICFSKELWFTLFLPAVVPELYKNNVKQQKANSLPLNQSHPCALKQIFSLENAEMRTGGAVPKDEFFVLGEPFFVNIRNFLNFNFSSLTQDSDDVEDSTKQRDPMALMGAINRQFSANADSLLESTRQAVRDKKQKLGKQPGVYNQKWDAFCKSSECRDLIMSYAVSDEFNPGRKKNTDFLLSEMSKARMRGEKFCVHPKTKPVGMDNRKTIFGNMVSLMYYKIDQLLRNHFHHEEQFLLLMSSLLMYTFNTDELRLHIVISGPSQAGKSFLIDMLERLSVPGLCKEYAQGSEKAHTTESNWNMHLIIADEGPKDILQRDSDNGATGVSTVKTMMTSGHLLVHRAFVDEKTKKIVTNETACERRCLFFIVMNPAFKMMSESIQSRVYKHHLPLINIKNEAIQEGRALNLDDFNAFRWTHQIRQSLASFVCILCDIDLVPYINMDIPIMFSNKISTRLEKVHNIVLDIRDWQRIFTFCKAMVLFYALELNFFTKPSTREFDILHLFETQPNLYCTKEIFWYSLGHFQNSIQSPYLSVVMNGFRLASNQGQANAAPVYEMIMDHSKGGKVPNEDYYFLEVTIVDRKRPISNLIGEIISNALGDSHFVKLSAEMIEDIILPNCEKVMVERGRRYYKMQFVNTMHKSGLRVSKVFYNEVMKHISKDILDDLVEFTMDAYTPNYDYILGTTDRMKKKSPYQLRTVTSRRDVLVGEGGNNRVIFFPNIHYKPPEYDMFMGRDEIINNIYPVEAKTTKLTRNIDKSIHDSLVKEFISTSSIHKYSVDPTTVFTFKDFSGAKKITPVTPEVEIGATSNVPNEPEAPAVEEEKQPERPKASEIGELSYESSEEGAADGSGKSTEPRKIFSFRAPDPILSFESSVAGLSEISVSSHVAPTELRDPLSEMFIASNTVTVPTTEGAVQPQIVATSTGGAIPPTGLAVPPQVTATSTHGAIPPTSGSIPASSVQKPSARPQQTQLRIAPLSVSEHQAVRGNQRLELSRPAPPDREKLKKEADNLRKKKKAEAKRTRAREEEAKKIRKKHQPISLIIDQASCSEAEEAEEDDDEDADDDSFIVRSDEEEDGISLGTADTRDLISTKKRIRVASSSEDEREWGAENFSEISETRDSILEEEEKEAMLAESDTGEPGDDGRDTRDSVKAESEDEAVL